MPTGEGVWVLSPWESKFGASQGQLSRLAPPGTNNGSSFTTQYLPQPTVLGLGGRQRPENEG